MTNILREADIWVFRFLNQSLGNAGLDAAVTFITGAGSGAFIFVVGMMMILAGKGKTKFSGSCLLAGLSFSYYTVSFIKDLVQRPRPFLTLSGVNLLYITGGFSFPSNHTATVFMACFILSRYFGKSLFFYSLAAAVAVSRIYLGLHYPSDVAAGALIGMLGGHILVKVAGAAGDR